MTNKELQEKLKQFPDDLPIVLYTTDMPDNTGVWRFKLLAVVSPHHNPMRRADGPNALMLSGREDALELRTLPTAG